MKRRICAFLIAPELLGQMFTHNSIVHVTSQVPKGSKVLRISYLGDRDAFMVVLENERFTPVEEGAQIPILDPPYLVEIQQQKKWFEFWR